MKSTPVMTNKEQRPSKYTVQLFDCGEQGKIQVLQKQPTVPFFRHESRSRLELGDCLQVGFLQGGDEVFEHGGEDVVQQEPNDVDPDR